MRPQSGDSAYLWDILDAALAIQNFIKGKTFNDYVNDRLLRGAVERHIEIMGEAARNVSEVFRIAHSEIPWNKVIAQRNVLAHEYGDIKHERIWAVVTVHIPDLIHKIERLIPNPPGDTWTGSI